MAGEMNTDALSLSMPDFLAAIDRSGALMEDQFEKLRAQVLEGAYPLDPPTLARHLVREKILTEFQARHLLKGQLNGLVIGRYSVLDRIGAGGMGWVFKARHQLMDRIVALKVISPEYSSRANATSRFLREMRLVGQLDHANVIRAFDADLYNGMHFMVMEYVLGQNLAQIHQRRGVLPSDEVIDYMAQAARGLAHAHDKGVIHRDIKPSNLLIDADGILKILDLGLGAFAADFVEMSRVPDTDRGKAVGTLEYVSPEQIASELVDGRADLFSLGCTAYEMLTGRLPFAGIGKGKRLSQRVHERHIPIAGVRPDLPPRLSAVIDRLLAIRPDDRFATAAEAAEAFEALIYYGERPPAGGSDGRGRKSPAPTTDLPAEPEPPRLDWSLIESALWPKENRSPPTLAPVRLREPASPGNSAKDLGLRRAELEEAGQGSGREIEQLYFLETVKLNREEFDKPKSDEDALHRSRRFRSLGASLEQFLTEPSLKQIALASLAVVLVITISLLSGLW
jgi:serine/threonine protein kinase